MEWIRWIVELGIRLTAWLWENRHDPDLDSWGKKAAAFCRKAINGYLRIVPWVIIATGAAAAVLSAAGLCLIFTVGEDTPMRVSFFQLHTGTNLFILAVGIGLRPGYRPKRNAQ